MDPEARFELLRHDAEWSPIRLAPEPGRMPVRTSVEMRRSVISTAVVTAVVAAVAGGLTWYGVSGLGGLGGGTRSAAGPVTTSAPPTTAPPRAGTQQAGTQPVAITRQPISGLTGGPAFLTFRVPASFEVVSVEPCQRPDVTYKPGVTGVVYVDSSVWGAAYSCPAEPVPPTPTHAPTLPPVSATLDVQSYDPGGISDQSNTDPATSGKVLRTVTAAGQKVLEIDYSRYGTKALLLVFTTSHFVVSVQDGTPSEPVVAQVLSTASAIGG